jgi:hypothetical protein
MLLDSLPPTKTASNSNSSNSDDSLGIRASLNRVALFAHLLVDERLALLWSGIILLINNIYYYRLILLLTM